MPGGRCGSSGARGSDDGLLLSLTPFQAGLLSAMLSPLKTQLAVICLWWKEQAFPWRWAMYQGDSSATGTDKLGPQVQHNGRGGHANPTSQNQGNAMEEWCIFPGAGG